MLYAVVLPHKASAAREGRPVWLVAGAGVVDDPLPFDRRVPGVLYAVRVWPCPDTTKGPRPPRWEDGGRVRAGSVPRLSRDPRQAS